VFAYCRGPDVRQTNKYMQCPGLTASQFVVHSEPSATGSDSTVQWTCSLHQTMLGKSDFVVCLFFFIWPQLAIRKVHYTVSYEPMRCPSLRCSRGGPATLPQCISLNVHHRFKRLYFGGCTSGSMRGLGCDSRAVRWVADRSRETVRTDGMCRSKWRVWLETYRDALVIVLRSLEWYR
jgi:hypothetical protein